MHGYQVGGGVAVKDGEIACQWVMESTVKVHGARFIVNLECFQRSSFPEAMCCLVNLCFLEVDAMFDVGMHYNPFFSSLVLSYSFFVLALSHQCTLCCSPCKHGLLMVKSSCQFNILWCCNELLWHYIYCKGGEGTIEIWWQRCACGWYGCEGVHFVCMCHL